MEQIIVKSARHRWPEQAGFTLTRPAGTPEYILLCFHSPVRILCGNELSEARGGDCLLYAPNQPQWFTSPGLLVHDWAHLQGGIAQAIESFGLRCGVLYHPESGEIQRIFERLERERQSGGKNSGIACDLLVRLLLVELTRSQKAMRKKPTVNPALENAIRALRLQMLEDPARGLNVPEMADKVHLSPSRFYSLYKNLYGLPPNEDIIQARIQRAKRLLETGQFTNAEVAARAGYTNEYHFIRQFTRRTGQSPQAFSRSNGRQPL